MDISDDIRAIESRAFKARLTMTQLCAEAQLLPQAWSRIKRVRSARPSTLQRLEDALDRIEAGREQAA